MNYLRYSASIIDNFLSNFQNFDLTYLVEDSPWVIKRVGVDLLKNIIKINNNFKTRLGLSPFLLKNQIVHFGSENIFFGKNRCHFPFASSKVILTWFHFVENDKRIDLLLKNQKRITYLHTACSQMKNRFVKFGFDESKIKVIPLGVDTKTFYHYSDSQKINIKRKFGLPENRFILGSFQKDGIGWGEGNRPKMIKGPDIFVETMIKLRKYHPFVLLSGPARGYVKNKLKENGIEFAHVLIEDYNKMPEIYNCLDLYLIASREEGGPMSLLESMACGVPVVSTPVGMCLDLIENRENGVVTDDFSPFELSENVERLIVNHELINRIKKNVVKQIRAYDLCIIAKKYYEDLYSF